MSVEAESDEQVYAEADVITSADVYLPPASLAVSGMYGPDQTPFIVDLCANDKILWRSYRAYTHLAVLHDELMQQGLNVGCFPERMRVYIGGIFGGSYAATDGAETRRMALASYLNKVLKETHGSAVGSRNKLFLSLSGKRLHDACVEGSVTTMAQLFSNWKSTTAVTAPFAHVNDAVEPRTGNTTLHLAAINAATCVPGSVTIVNSAIDAGADIMHPNSELKSPLLVALEALEQQYVLRREGSAFAAANAEAALSKTGDGHKVVRALLRAGADAGEVTANGRSILHLCAASALTVEELASKVPRLLRVRDVDGRTPLDYAIEFGAEDTIAKYKEAGGKTGAELAEAHEHVEAEAAKFDDFLSLAVQSNEEREQVAILVKLGELYQESDPLLAAKLYNCASFMAKNMFKLPEEQTQANGKLIELEAHLFAHYGIQAANLDSAKKHERITRHQQEVRDIRSGLATQMAKSGMREVQQWLAQKVETLFHKLVDEVIKSFAKPPPCAYAFVSLGDLATKECGPSMKLSFMVLVDKCSHEVLEYFRLAVELLHLRVINLHETECKVLNGRSRSPIESGLSFDYTGEIPFRAGRFGAMRLVDTPERLARLQEPIYFDRDAALSFTLADSARYLYGQKALFDAYRIEVNKILDRQRGTSSVRLRQARAVQFLRSEAHAWRPKYNKEPNDEKYFELQQLEEFPHRTLRMLALYFGVSGTDRTSVYELVDGLVYASHLKKEAGEDLKRALTLARQILVKVGEQNLVDIRDLVAADKAAAAAATATATATAASDDATASAVAEEGDDATAPDTQHDDADAAGDGGDDGATVTATTSSSSSSSDSGASQPQQQQQQSQKVSLYKLTQDDLAIVVEILQVLHPMWLVSKQFNESNDRIFTQATFYENTNRSLADAYFRITLYRRAEKHYLAAYQENADNFNMKNLLGLMWNKLQDYEKAIECFKEYAEALRLSHAVGAELSSAYTNIGMANVNLSRNFEAISWLEKALAVDKEVYGEQHEHVATDYYYLGKICHREKEFSKGIEYLSRAIAIHERTNNREKIAGFNADLGMVYTDMENYDDAIKHTSVALQMEKTLRGEVHATVAVLLRRLGDLYLKVKQESRALELTEQAADINVRVYGHDHPKHAEDEYTIGIICFRLKMLEPSLEHLRTSLAVYLKVLDDENDKLIIEVREAIEMVEHELARTRMSPEEYEAWKRRMEEERLRRLAKPEEPAPVEEAPEQPAEDDEQPEVEREPIIRSSGQVGTSSLDVFDDEFFEL